MWRQHVALMHGIEVALPRVPSPLALCGLAPSR